MQRAPLFPDVPFLEASQGTVQPLIIQSPRIIIARAESFEENLLLYWR